MGAAKSNPMSPQFRGQYPTEVPLAAIDVIRHPTPEWYEEHRDWKETGLPIPDEHALVSMMLVIKRVEPSALFPGQPQKWPSSDEIALGPLLFMQTNARGEYEAIPATMPLAKFRELTPIGGAKAADKEAPVMLEDEVSVTGS
jgi:hypothetical protein